MKRSWLFIIIAILSVLSVSLVACNASNDLNAIDDVDYSDHYVVFLGDSIAEGIIGVSPEEERINYAYYGVLGQINGYHYENRAISGNQTKDLLQYVTTPESDANMPITHLSKADMICISITGNDILFHNFPCMMYEIIAKKVIGDDYINDQRVKDCYLYNKKTTIDDINGVYHLVTPGDGLQSLEDCKIRARANLNSVLKRIRELNPTAKVFFQNTYNPVDNESELIPLDLVSALIELDPSYDYSTPSGVEKYREMGVTILGSMSDILKDISESNENVYFVDVAKVFNEVYQADQEKGKALLFVDGVHPSDKGHALIAEIYQNTFVQMGLAENVKSLEKYKELRLKQFDRMFKEEYQQNGSIDTFKTNLKNAKTMSEVDDVYFGATDKLTAKIYDDPTEGRTTNGVAVKETETYTLSNVEMLKADQNTQDTIEGLLPMISKLYMNEKSLTLNTDGTMEIRLGLKTSKLLSYVKGMLDNLNGSVVGGIEDQIFVNEDGSVTILKMSGATDTYPTIKVYANELFPGMGFGEGTLGKNFSMLYNSLGLNIEGLEPLTSEKYVDEIGLPLNMGENREIDPETIGIEYDSYADYLTAYLSRYTLLTDKEGRQVHVDTLPTNLSEQLQKLGDLTVVIKTVYSLVTLNDINGKEYDAVFAGQYYENTSPFMILTRSQNEDEEDIISFANQMIGIRITFTKE